MDNDNFGALSEQVNAAAIIAHPYHWPVVGWASDIEAWTMQDLETYYSEGYAPNNCIMVVVGDVKRPSVFSVGAKYFEVHSVSRNFRGTAHDRTRARRAGFGSHRERSGVAAAHLCLPYAGDPGARKTPRSRFWRLLMATGESSRLYSRLVDQEQAALSVQMGDEPSLDPFLITVLVQPRAGVPDISQFSAARRRAWKGLNARPESELRKAKNQWLAAHYREMKTIAGSANLLGTYDIFYGELQKAV